VPPRISVVIPTFERPDACAEAVESALAQTLEPLEVIVCDDGSGDGTRERFSGWERRDPRVRYLGLPHTGRPAPARNAGTRAARGDWVALLDDDDTWRPDKLAIQAPHLEPGRVVATNAQRTSGGAYFPELDAPYEPARAELLRVNPVITSTAVVERSAALAAGGFHEAPWALGVEDFALWLSLADRGTRFLVLPDVTVDYRDHTQSGRLSNRLVRQEAALARLSWQRWLRRPVELARLTAAGNHTVAAARLWRLSRRGAASG
jgi:glycosyltransferase involved in cell wall biosynthesis